MTDNRAYAKHLLTALYDLLIEFLDEAPAAAKPRLDSLLNEEPIFAKPDTCVVVNPDTGHSCQRLPGHTQYAAQHFGPDDEYWTDPVSAPEPESEDGEGADDERLSMACDWSDFRKDYGVSPDPDVSTREHRAFLAGWQAGRHGDQSGVLR